MTDKRYQVVVPDTIITANDKVPGSPPGQHRRPRLRDGQ
jgi:hypothetical protein